MDEIPYLRALIDDIEDIVQAIDEHPDNPFYDVVHGPGGLVTAVFKKLFVSGFDLLISGTTSAAL
jgi:hypothetical protein